MAAQAAPGRRGLVLGGLGRAAWLSTGRDARLRSLQISLVHGFSAKEPRGASPLRRLLRPIINGVCELAARKTLAQSSPTTSLVEQLSHATAKASNNLKYS